ncbi:septum formation family protein [Paenarthrobacter nitroguajacolicus]|uniref:septum formation family protein n=1 Tax=Paenarthrobacter nitroguajacolicus TaxID=211146 RepID=UPI003AEBD83E
MSQENTSPRDGSPREQGKDGVPPAPPTPPSPGQQPPASPSAPPSGLQPDPAPDLDPDFVPEPGDQPDPALPPTDAAPAGGATPAGGAGPARDADPAGNPQDPVGASQQATAGQPPAGQQPQTAPWQPPSGRPQAGQQPYLGQQAYTGQESYTGQEWRPQPQDDPAIQGQPEPHGDPVKRQRWVIGGIVVGVLILIGVVIWVLLNLLGTRPEAAVSTPSAAPTAGPLPRDADATDFQVGDCFADFDANASKARAVACDTEHSAQLGAVFSYPADDSFPGTNALREKGREVCKTVKLNAAADNYVLLQQNVYPSTSSWDGGDRRVDCFIVVDSGNTITEDLLAK